MCLSCWLAGIEDEDVIRAELKQSFQRDGDHLMPISKEEKKEEEK